MLLLVESIMNDIGFRNRIEKEIQQTLEELTRQNDMRRMNMLQDQVRTNPPILLMGYSVY